MVGSTNHLDQLDPGIAKRPSRFDRKYFFPNPNLKERVAYAKFWQAKLADNKDVEFPDAICDATAEITGGFSFAYMQEAFVASLLTLARRDPEEESIKDGSIPADDFMLDVFLHGFVKAGDNLDEFPLWRELQKQVKNLKEEMDRDATTVPSGLD